MHLYAILIPDWHHVLLIYRGLLKRLMNATCQPEPESALKGMALHTRLITITYKWHTPRIYSPYSIQATVPIASPITWGNPKYKWCMVKHELPRYLNIYYRPNVSRPFWIIPCTKDSVSKLRTEVDKTTTFAYTQIEPSCTIEINENTCSWTWNRSLDKHQYTKNHLNSTKCWLNMQISDQVTWFPVCPLSRPRPTPVRWGLLRVYRAQQLMVNQQPSEPREKLNDVILLGFRGDC